MKLFRRREPIHPDLAAALDRLDQLAEATPSLRDAAVLQGAILRTIAHEPPHVGALDMTPERAAEKLNDGVPLLRGEQVPLDLLAIAALALQLCQAMREHGGAVGEIGAAIGQGVLSIAPLV